MKRVMIVCLGSVFILVSLLAVNALFIPGATPDQPPPKVLAAARNPGRTIVVNSTADSGPGTLRQALLDAQSGDTITFDPSVFPPGAPATIAPTSGLPEINQGNLTIDASNAGVILDGSNIGTTPETLLLDDISLTLDGGPNLIANGDFGAGFGHWRPWDTYPGATRNLNTTDFNSPPSSYEWSTTAQSLNSNTVYDITDTSAPIDGWPFDQGTTAWITVSGGSTAEWRFWYRYGDIDAGLHILFPDGHEEAWWWYFDWQPDWTEAVISRNLPSDAVGVALELEFNHPQRWTPGFHINSSHNTIRGFQIINLLWDGVRVDSGAQHNAIGGDRDIGDGPMGQGNLISGNAGNGVYIGGPDSGYNTLQGNFIGLDATGAGPLGNGEHGVVLRFATHHNTIIGNVISGNRYNGVEAIDDDVGNLIKDNLIGLDATGTAAIGNGGAGICMRDDSWDDKAPRLTQILANVISGNGREGILIQGGAAMSNTVSSNYIGTDVDGTSAVPNAYGGVTIRHGANHNLIGGNTVGSANVIAYNNHHGLGVYGLDALFNTISRNSIHDNDGTGIDLRGGGNSELVAPVFFDFDLSAGTITGTACSSCAVEIFSDGGTQGELYEGQAIADDKGIFFFHKGAAFTGPHLTATTTDRDGNTSEFLLPTLGSSGVLLQEGNSLPKIRLQPKHSGDLEDNRIGAHMDHLQQWNDPDEFFPYGVLDGNYLLAPGFKRLRSAINNPDSSSVNWSLPEFTVTSSQDDLITSLADNGFRIAFVLSFWDKAFVAGGGEIPIPRFKTEEEIQRYLDHVRFIVHHFKDRIEYYEIWNEPSVKDTIQWIEVEDYINLVKRAVPVIRQEYPEAKIVVGGTHGLHGSDSQTYLFSILQSDIMPLVDAISWHPMYGISPEYESEYYYEYPTTVQEIKEAASAHGFTGEYVGDELVWRTPDLADPRHPEEQTYSDIKTAKYVSRGILIHAGMDVAVSLQIQGWGKPYWSHTVQNLLTTMAGTEPASLPIQIQTTATNTVSYTFSLPSGAHLIALWTDGVAVDDDPGIPSTLTVPGLTEHTAVGIDVLHGFQQQLVTSEENGDLVIRDLLIKDYPLILWVYEPKYVFLPVVTRATPGN